MLTLTLYPSFIGFGMALTDAGVVVSAVSGLHSALFHTEEKSSKKLVTVLCYMKLS